MIHQSLTGGVGDVLHFVVLSFAVVQNLSDNDDINCELNYSAQNELERLSLL